MSVQKDMIPDELATQTKRHDTDELATQET
jgi:hypothetical protein